MSAMKWRIQVRAERPPNDHCTHTADSFFSLKSSQLLAPLFSFREAGESLTGHFGPKKLRTQDTSVLGLKCLKSLRHFGPIKRSWDTSDPGLKCLMERSIYLSWWTYLSCGPGAAATSTPWLIRPWFNNIVSKHGLTTGVHASRSIPTWCK